MATTHQLSGSFLITKICRISKTDSSAYRKGLEIICLVGVGFRRDESKRARWD